MNGTMAGRQHDKRKVRPGRLMSHPGVDRLVTDAMKCFLCDQREASSLVEPFAKILQRGTDLAGKTSLDKLLSCGTRIAPHGRENKDPLVMGFNRSCHDLRQAKEALRHRRIAAFR